MRIALALLLRVSTTEGGGKALGVEGDDVLGRGEELFIAVAVSNDSLREDRLCVVATRAKVF